MPFKKGQSGNPAGPPPTVKPWRDALRKAMAERDPVTKKQYIQIIAEKTREQALAGDIQHAKEIGDRLDGRSAPSPEEREDMNNLIVNVLRFGDRKKV